MTHRLTCIQMRIPRVNLTSVRKCAAKRKCRASTVIRCCRHFANLADSSTRLPSEQPEQFPTPEVTATDSPSDFDMLEEQSEVERSPPERAKGPVVNTQDAEHRSEIKETRDKRKRRVSKPPRRMKVPWSQDEEEKLLREARDHGKDWVGIRDRDIAGTLMFFIACAYKVSDLSIY